MKRVVERAFSSRTFASREAKWAELQQKSEQELFLKALNFLQESWCSDYESPKDAEKKRRLKRPQAGADSDRRNDDLQAVVAEQASCDRNMEYGGQQKVQKGRRVERKKYERMRKLIGEPLDN